MSDALRERFPEVYNGGPVPSVDPEDMKRMWDYNREHVGPGVMVSVNIWKAILSPGANIFAVCHRSWMLGMMQVQKLLTPWERGDRLDDKVFRVMATFPLEYMKLGVQYTGPPFDADGFLQKLREDQGA